MSLIVDSWKRIIDWYAANTPAGSLNLSRGASKKAIDEVETVIKMSLPADLKESYRLHNGNPDMGGVFSHGKYLLTLEAIAKEWESWSRAVKKGAFKNLEDLVLPKGPIKKTWWNTSWIPITGSGGGDFGCVDMDPAPGARPARLFISTTKQALFAWMRQAGRRIWPISPRGSKTALLHMTKEMTA